MRWIAWKTTTPIPNHWSPAAWKAHPAMRQAAGAARLRTAEQVLRRKALMSWRQSPRSPLLRAAHPSLAHPEPVARHQELVFEQAGAVVHHWTTGAVRRRMAPKDRQKRVARAEIYYSSTWIFPFCVAVVHLELPHPRALDFPEPMKTGTRRADLFHSVVERAPRWWQNRKPSLPGCDR